jgi:CHAT domain
MSGDLPGLAEPALMLTPPAQATADDDGLLTASKIANLKLDADWVVLSACNTAASGNASDSGGLQRRRCAEVVGMVFGSTASLMIRTCGAAVR